MDKKIIHQISVSIIQSGVLQPTAFDSQHVLDCREIISMYNADSTDPNINEKVKQLLANMNQSCTESDILEFVAEIKTLYIDNFM